MRNTAMRVRVEDRSAGTTLVDATLSVEADRRTTSAPLSTSDDALTCVTTLRLA